MTLVFTVDEITVLDRMAGVMGTTEFMKMVEDAYHERYEGKEFYGEDSAVEVDDATD